MAESSVAVYAAMAGNAAVAAMKLTAAAFTGSSSMFAEGLHSAVDTANESLLLLGRRLSRRPPDDLHPFGHGQELYFWTLIVALIVFTAGGAVSAYEGVLKLLNPSPPDRSIWNYIILGAASVFEGISFSIGVRQLLRTYPNRGFLEVVRTAKDPSTFTVVFEDASDLVGLALAFLGIYLSRAFRTSLFDGVATILIGMMLMGIAVMLVRQSRGLLTGEAVGPGELRRIRAILESDSEVESVEPPLTMYFGPDTVLLAVNIRFREELQSRAVAQAIERLETAVRSEYPKVKRIFVEADALRNVNGRKRS